MSMLAAAGKRRKPQASGGLQVPVYMLCGTLLMACCKTGSLRRQHRAVPATYLLGGIFVRASQPTSSHYTPSHMPAIMRG